MFIDKKKNDILYILIRLRGKICVNLVIFVRFLSDVLFIVICFVVVLVINNDYKK